MLLTRTSAVLVGGGILAALIASPALMRTSPLRPVEPTRPFATDAKPAVVHPTRIAALLARRTAAVQASRNPFAFATRSQPPATGPKTGSAPAMTVMPPSEAPRPALTLSAIAEQPGENGVTIRTAVLSVAGQVFLAGEGEHATPRFTVLHVTSDVVELRDEATDTILRLALR